MRLTGDPDRKSLAKHRDAGLTNRSQKLRHTGGQTKCFFGAWRSACTKKGAAWNPAMLATRRLSLLSLLNSHNSNFIRQILSFTLSKIASCLQNQGPCYRSRRNKSFYKVATQLEEMTYLSASRRTKSRGGAPMAELGTTLPQN